MKKLLIILTLVFGVTLSGGIPPVSACECFDGNGESQTVTAVSECIIACDGFLSTESDPGTCFCGGGSFTSIDCSITCQIEGLSNEDPTLISSSGTTVDTTKQLLTPTLNVPIPDLTFSPILDDGNALTISFIGEYISGLYKYLLGVATLIAIVMIMIGGLQYTFAASGGEVGKAKKRITDAATGLVLLLSVYMILYAVNPQLVGLGPITLENIQYVDLVNNSGDSGGNITTENLNELGIDCSGSGDVSEIARAFVGKTAYRFGGKGGNPPYESESKVASDGTPYKDYCPDGNICLDCSGFVATVATCAGLESKGESGGTAGIFASAPSILSCNKQTVTLTDGTTHRLTEGDLVGYKPGDREDKPEFGHVWMYIGDGMLINSVGGAGRLPGSAVIEQSLNSACGLFPLRFVNR
jgi:hypothetical protein